MTRSRNLRLLGASLTMAGVLALPSVAFAETDRTVRDATTEVQPTDVRPERAPKLEALRMKCAQIEPGVAGVECAWRPATHPRAAGYQLWRIIDRDHRELVWRGGLDTTSNVARVPADATVARYAVLAVDENGRIVGQSRVQTVRLRLPEIDVRPVDPTPVDVKPVDVKPVDVKPADVTPVSVRTLNSASKILRF